MRNFSMRSLAAVAAIVMLGVAGCATKPDVRGDYDKSVDFGKYKTYNFVAQPSTDTSNSRSLATQFLQKAAAREMESRGYTRADFVEHIRSEHSTFRWLFEPMLTATGFEILDVEYTRRTYARYLCRRGGEG